jgi:signal transduction histidine kinase
MKGLRGIKNLSLRGRFAWVFGGLLALAILFCGILYWEQHGTATQGVELALRTQEKLGATLELREAFGDLRSSSGKARFRDLAARSTIDQPQLSAALARDLDGYLGALRSPSVAAKWLNVLRLDVDRVAAANRASTHQDAARLLVDQSHALHVALGFLGGFIFLLGFAAYKISAVITEPLSSLVRFLDAVNVEDDLPAELPHFDSGIPEVQHVSQSFEQLLGRLRGYRALNVRRLLIEKRRAEIIANSISDGVFLLRGEEVLYVNPVGEHIFGITRGIANAFPPGKSLHLRQCSHLPGAQAVLSAVSRSLPIEFSVDEPHRTTHYLIQAYPILGEVIEQAEQHANEEGSDGVLERFQPDVIVVATDVTLVHESQEAKRHFLGTLSHEVKTPVTSLTMATRLLKRNIDQIENPTQRALVTTCIDDVDRLRGLLEDLLTVSRFETIAQRMEVQTVDFNKLVRHAIQSFQADARTREIELTLKVNNPTGRPIQIPMDATKVSWALTNLLTNAIRHTPVKGQVSAELNARDEDVVVRIRDTGPGIEAARQARIFDKFNSRYDLRVARTGGAGVGLAIAREIVVAHGGHIWVESEPGQGSVFSFTLPLKRVSGDAIRNLDLGLKAEMKSSTDNENLKGAARGTTASS